MDELLKQAANIIFNSKMTIALTGAGISTESGIPDFRSSGGLWSKYNPSEFATISAFKADPLKVWKMLHAMDKIVSGAKPNAAHIGMCELEKMGFLECIITQNVDNLHQAGGSSNVIEYHGNSRTLSCLWCGKGYPAEKKSGSFPPICECQQVLKPDVIFFEEMIPALAMNRSLELASSAQCLMVVGTSALVSPANLIPGIAKRNNAKIIEINKERTHLSNEISDLFLQGSASKIISALVNLIKNKG